MNSQAKNGHELELEIKFYLCEEEYNKLVDNFKTKFSINYKSDILNFSDTIIKTRNYRDYDTYDSKLRNNGSSLTARERSSDFAVTAKFPSNKNNTRHEYNDSISPKTDNFYSYDFMSSSSEPINIVKGKFGTALKEIIRRKVITNRVNIFLKEDLIAEIAIDKIIAQSINTNKEIIFFELEIEEKSSKYKIKHLIEIFEDILKTELVEVPYASKYEQACLLLGL